MKLSKIMTKSKTDVAAFGAVIVVKRSAVNLQHGTIYISLTITCCIRNCCTELISLNIPIESTIGQQFQKFANVR